MKKSITLIIALTFILSACTMHKRIYTSGYDVEWGKGLHKRNTKGLAENKTNDAVKSKSENIVEPVAKMELAKTLIDNNTEVNNDNLIASVDNSIMPMNIIPSQQKEFSINTLDGECDNIVLTNGEEIKAKVTEITTDEIKYKRCDNLIGPAYTIKKTAVFMIQYANGTKDVFTPANTTSSNITKTDNTKTNLTDKCTAGQQDAIKYHGKAGGHYVLGLLFGPFAILGTAFADPTPENGRKTYVMSQNKDMFGDATYRLCYKKKAKGRLIGAELCGWAFWILLLIL